MIAPLTLLGILAATDSAALTSLTLPSPGGESIVLRLEQVTTLDERAQWADVRDGRETLRTLDGDRVRIFRTASIDGSMSGVLATAPTGGLGWLDTPQGRLVLSGSSEDGAPGLRPGPWRWECEGPGAAAPVDELCSMLDVPGHDGGVAGAVGPATPQLTRLVRLAADLDYEFVSMFADAEAATDYAIALYGAGSFILERDCDVRLVVSYLRTFSTPDDPFNDADPLYQFRDHWETNQTAVVRDLAQLLTGRRNLPYGGVAWLNATCTNYGYSVSGYMIGSFADATATNPGNWDVIVSTHELGHNLGTRHTHDYGIDSCASGSVQRGTIMSYCHVVSGATANIDLRMHRVTGDAVRSFIRSPDVTCLGIDCNSNGLSDAQEIAAGALTDDNSDGIADACQDCDGDGILDPIELEGGAPDMDLNGVPDSCQVDCNTNVFPDEYELAQALASDVDGNNVIDGCDPDCDANGIADGVDLIVGVSRDRDRDGTIDTCEDCNANGIPDNDELAGALGVWTIQASPPLLVELDGRSGVQRRAINLVTLGGLTAIFAVVTTPSNSLLIAGATDIGPTLVEFDRTTATLRTIATVASGFPVVTKMRMAGLPSGSTLCVDALVPSLDRIIRYRVSDGVAVLNTAYLPAANTPVSFARQGDGFYILNTDGSLLRSAGAALPTLPFATMAAGADPTDLVALPDGRVLVTDRATDSIQAFSMSGAALGRFDFGPNPGTTVALTDPTAILMSAQRPDIVFAMTQGGSAALHGHRTSDGYYLRTYRFYRVDAVGSDGFAQIGPSSLDADMNFVLDACEVFEPADINGDGSVDGIDLTQLLSAWGSSDPAADIDNDGIVGGQDLTAILSAWSS